MVRRYHSTFWSKATPVAGAAECCTLNLTITVLQRNTSLLGNKAFQATSAAIYQCKKPARNFWRGYRVTRYEKI